MSHPKVSLYELLCEESQLGMVVVNSNHEIIYANRTAKDNLEFDNKMNIKDVKIEKLYPKISNNQRTRGFSSELFQMEGLFQDIVVSKISGQNFIAVISIKKVFLDAENVYLVSFQDISIQKKLQREILEKQNAINSAYQELLEQNKQLKDLDLAKNRFIAMTTHELRTPLSAMTASAEILHLKIFDTPEQHDEFVKMIYDQGQHMLNLVNDILDFAKIQADKMDYYVEQQDPYTALHDDVENLKSMAEQAEVSVLILDKPSESLLCYYDGVRLRQVATNLINNAIKYNKPGGNVKVWLEGKTDVVEIHIQDNGKGISKENHAKVFNEFETLGNTANHSKGTGLGLPISKKMIEYMGGQIFLDSDLGVGSHFWITIPKNKVLAEVVYRSRPDQDSDLAA
jgi:signal transduction histidine kinase